MAEHHTNHTLHFSNTVMPGQHSHICTITKLVDGSQQDVICRSPQDVALSLVMMTMVCTAAGYVLTRSFNQKIETHV